jgi:hypothetical protein
MCDDSSRVGSCGSRRCHLRDHRLTRRRHGKPCVVQTLTEDLVCPVVPAEEVERVSIDSDLSRVPSRNGADAMHAFRDPEHRPFWQKVRRPNLCAAAGASAAAGLVVSVLVENEVFRRHQDRAHRRDVRYRQGVRRCGSRGRSSAGGPQCRNSDCDAGRGDEQPTPTVACPMVRRGRVVRKPHWFHLSRSFDISYLRTWCAQGLPSGGPIWRIWGTSRGIAIERTR